MHCSTFSYSTVPATGDSSLCCCAGVFSKEKMRNFRSLEAYEFFRSGWVQDIVHVTTATRALLLKAKVRRSQRVTETPHTAWVALSEEGVVLAGHCTCMAGYVM